MRVLVPVALLPAIAFGIKVIPHGVPDRWGKVKTYLERFCDGNSAVLASTTIQVCSSELRKKVLAHYLVTVPECPGFKSGCLSLPGLCATVLLRHSCKLRKTLAPHLAALPIWHLHFSIFTQRQNLLLTLSLTFNTGVESQEKLQPSVRFFESWPPGQWTLAIWVRYIVFTFRRPVVTKCFKWN